jgi:hypothetical protein
VGVTLPLRIGSRTTLPAKGWQWMGNTLWVDHRPAAELLDGLVSAGMEVTET